MRKVGALQRSPPHVELADDNDETHTDVMPPSDQVSPASKRHYRKVVRHTSSTNESALETAAASKRWPVFQQPLETKQTCYGKPGVAFIPTGVSGVLFSNRLQTSPTYLRTLVTF